MAKYLDEAGLQVLVQQIKENISMMYEIKGSAVYADTAYLADQNKPAGITSTGIWQLTDGTWSKVTEFKEGWVYNIQNDFTTNNDFVEGTGTSVKGGTNIAVVKSGNVYKFDVLAVATNITNNIGSELPAGVPDTPLTTAEIEAMFAGN